MTAEPAEDLKTVAPSEASRVRARDRKRTIRMVVDNAAVKRLLLARQARREPAAHDDRNGAAKPE